MTVNHRRVGTLTLGICLICAGTLFAARLFFPDIFTYYFIFRLWPVTLILLGIEVLVSHAGKREQKITYDGWAIFIMILILCLAATMAGCQILLEHGLAQGYITF